MTKSNICVAQENLNPKNVNLNLNLNLSLQIIYDHFNFTLSLGGSLIIFLPFPIFSNTEPLGDRGLNINIYT